MTRVGIIYGQAGGIGAGYSDQSNSVSDVGFSGGFGFPHGIGIGIQFDGQNYSEPVVLVAIVPSPYFLNQNAQDARPTANSLDRRERALDISAEYTIPTPDWLRVRVYGGPTYFHVSNQMVSSVSYDQTALPVNTVAIRQYTSTVVTGQSVGFHVGADAAYFFSRHVGVGGGARFNRGNVTVPDPLSAQDAVLRVGHLASSGGLRLRF